MIETTTKRQTTEIQKYQQMASEKPYRNINGKRIVLCGQQWYLK